MKNRQADPETRKADEKLRADFILKKGPDFVSRLDAHFNVIGPNQRRLFNFETGKWGPLDDTDIGFPIRRALVMRSVLRLDDHAPLQIEPALLPALLRVSRFRHSLRSLKKLVLLLHIAPGEPLRRANLPSRNLLARHLQEANDLDNIFAEALPYRTDKHELWMDFHLQNSWVYSPNRDKARRRHPLLLPFNQLLAEERKKDHKAIQAYPELAKLAGYKIVFLEATTADPKQAAKRGKVRRSTRQTATNKRRVQKRRTS